MTMEATHAYRHLYRALARLYGKEKRKTLHSSEAYAHLREVFKSNEMSLRQAENVISFLKGKKGYEDLLARYNPAYGKSDKDRLRMTANRVGLEWIE